MLFYFTFGCISEDIIHDGTLVGNAGSSKGKLAENAFFVYGSSADENDNGVFISNQMSCVYNVCIRDFLCENTPISSKPNFSSS